MKINPNRPRPGLVKTLRKAVNLFPKSGRLKQCMRRLGTTPSVLPRFYNPLGISPVIMMFIESCTYYPIVLPSPKH